MKKSIFLFFAAILCAIGVQGATWTVAGSDKAILNGDKTWEPTDKKNDLSNVSGTQWGLLLTNKTLAKTTYKFKICKDYGWGTAYPGSDYELKVNAADTYNLLYTFNTNGNAVNATLFKTWTVAGSSAALGSDWKPEDANNDMTRDGSTFDYKLTKTNVNLKKSTTYECKVVKDHAWGEAYPGSNKTYTVDADGYYNVTFNFNVVTKAVTVTTTLIKNTVTASANPAEGGSVNGAGEYAKGSNVTLTATPATGYEFVNWTEGETVVSTSTQYNFDLLSDVNLVANFKIPVPDAVKYQVNASANDNTMGTVTGTGEYEENATAILTATPNVGYQFVNWTVGGEEKSTNTTYSFTVTEAVEVVANFKEIPKVTVYFVNNSGWSKINAYAWEGAKGANPGWPGADITANKLGEQIGGFDVYSYTVEQGSYGKVIFNNGSAQTKDYVWTDGNYYWNNKAEGFVGGSKADAESELSVPVEYEYVYLINTNDWTKALIYTWTPEVASYPGAAMTKEAEQIAGKDVYSYKVVKGSTFGGLNFNCGGDECKTGDLTWQAGKYYAPSKNTWFDTKEAAAEALAAPAKCYLMGIGGDWTTGIEMEEDGDQFKLLCQPIAEGEQFKFKYGDTWTTEVENYDANGVNWVESYPGSGQYNITLPAGNYDFYYKKNDNKVWIGVCTPATPTLVTPTVVANSYFSVGEGKFVQFSAGNLQYNVGTNTWSFATNQYDYVGADNINVGDPTFTGTIDMFGWSADGKFGVNPSNKNEDYNGDFVDWGTLVNEANWYTLSADEWKYLLNTRANAKNLKQIAKVDNVVGIMLVPDAWTMPADVNVAAAYDDYFKVNIYNYTLEQWTKLEEVGAVFLPAAGRRAGGYGNMINYNQETETNSENLNGGHYKHYDNGNIYCYYWTSTINASTKNVSYLHNIRALGNDEYTIGTGAVWGEKGRYGQSVRLVKKATPDYERTVKSGDYGTICLPNGGLLFGASAFSVAKMEGTTILLDEVGTTMVGGTPYVVFPNTGATNLYVFYTDNVNAPAGYFNGLYGSYERRKLEANVGNYIMLPGNKYAEVTGDRVYVGEKRAYFKVSEIPTTAPAPAPGVRRIAIGQAPQVATGMENIDASAQPVKTIINGQFFILRGEKMYDAQGKLVK